MSLVRRLKRDSDGATIVEFALVSPVLLVMVMGIIDLGHTAYTNAMLLGAIQDAARGSSIEGAAPATIDAQVTDIVDDITPGASLTFARKSYTNFSGVAQPEEYDDADSDTICNNGEAFEDANGNGLWDADQGKTGNGGARDAVVYTVSVTYPRLLPLDQLLGQSNTVTLKSTTVLRNQPFGLQSESTATGNCT